MPATIDVLQIEIETASGKAANGIRDLALALGELKKNGAFKTAVNNLNNLRNSLRMFNNIPSNASKVLSLANSLKELNGVKSFGGISGNMTKLAEGMKQLSTVDVGNVAPKLRDLASAVAPLSGFRSGVGSMVKSLGDIGKVTASLDDDTINQFADRVQKLSDKLKPLSDKMTTVKAGLKDINKEAKSAGSSVKKMGGDLDAASLNLSSFIYSIQEAVGWLQQAIQKFSEFMADAIEWDGIAARFGRTFGENAEETYNWIQRLNEEMGINVQQFMQYSSLYAQMLTGFGVATEDAQTMAVGYTELTYDIWASANDRYKTFQDAADAVASAIAGEVEPIRRAGFTIVESTLAETAAYHGLDISMANATESQKSYLRYLTLVDQAQSTGTIGVYAKELNTAEGLVRTFTQQLKSLSQAFGSLFLPVLTMVMPYLSAFVELLIDAVNWIAALFGFKIQDIRGTWGDVSTGVGDLADSADNAQSSLGGAAKAAKDLQKATLGIDELNVISPQTSSGGGGGGGGAGGDDGFAGLDVESLWDESIFADVQRNVDEIKEKLMDWLPTIGAIGAALALWRVANLIEDLEKVTPILKGLATGLKIAAISIVVGKLVWDFTGAYLEGGDEADLLKALGTTVLGSALAYYLARKMGLGAAGAGIVLVTSGVVSLTRLAIELKEGTVEFTDPEALVTGFVGAVETAIGAALTWKTLGPIIKTAFPKLISSVSAWLTGGGAAAIGAAAPWVAVAAAIAGYIVMAFVDYDFTEIGVTIGEKVGEAVKWAFDNLSPLGLSIRLYNWIKDELDVDSLVELVAVLFDPKTWTDVILPKIEEIFVNIGEWFKEQFDNLAGNIGEFQDGILEGLGKAFDIDLSSLDFITVNDIWDVVALIFPITAPKNFVNNIIESLREYCSEHQDDAASAFKNLFGEDLFSFSLSEMWENAKTWWNKKDGLKEYTPSIGSISGPLSAAWSNAKKWWDKKKPKLSTYTPSIGSISSKLSSAWSKAKSWWKERKGTLSYTPSIGSIRDKLSTAWSNAKKWWKEKKGSLSYTPSIGSIKEKLQSAWKTAKKWWDDNVKLSIPSLSFKVTYSTKNLGSVKKAIVDALNLPGWPKLSFAANGGIFDAGSLIWAGESGAEVVANAGGGKTGVMNVEQMQTAVYEGVYSAVMAAMSRGGGSGSQNVNVYLDGKQIYSSVKRTESERGRPLMGNQLGYNY